MSPKRIWLIAVAGVLALEALSACWLTAAAPTGTRWLGDTLFFPGDSAVYLSYLEQGAHGAVLLDNLYAVEPHLKRFDAVWSALALTARSGMAPIAIDEGARVFFTIILLTAVWFAARDLVTERTSRLGLALVALLGGSGGALYSVGLNLMHAWTFSAPVAADVGSEFAIAPALFGGVQVILSIALLLTGLRFAWPTEKNETRRGWLALACFVLLFAFHPYFVPLVSIYLVITSVVTKKIAWRPALGFVGAFVYLPFLADPTFVSHHLQNNILPLAPWLAWTCTLTPWLIAYAWRWHKKITISTNERWLIAWIASALACLLLPLPFHRKFLEGAGIACAWLAAPAFMAAYHWLVKKGSRLYGPMTLVSVLALGLTPLHVIASDFAAPRSPSLSPYLYQPDGVFAAWSFIEKTNSPRTIVVSDDPWINIWTPAESGTRVYVGHDQETPDFARKAAAVEALFSSGDLAQARTELSELPVNELLLVHAGQDQVILRAAKQDGFAVVYQNTNAVVLSRP